MLRNGYMSHADSKNGKIFKLQIKNSFKVHSKQRKPRVFLKSIEYRGSIVKFFSVYAFVHL